MCDADLYKNFNAQKKALNQEINNVKLKPQTVLLKQKINALSDSIQQQISIIPSYDLKYYTNEIKVLNELLDKKQATFQTKFSFRSRDLKKISSNNNAKAAAIKSDFFTDDTQEADLKVLQSKNEKVYRSLSGQFINASSTSQHLLFEKVDNSIIKIVNEPTDKPCAIHIKDCQNIVLYADIEGSIMINNLNSSSVKVRCHQLRIHNSEKLQLSVNVSALEFIIEKCERLTLFDYDDICLATNVTVNDFSHPSKDSTNPHYKVCHDTQDFLWIFDEDAVQNRLLNM